MEQASDVQRTRALRRIFSFRPRCLHGNGRYHPSDTDRYQNASTKKGTKPISTSILHSSCYDLAFQFAFACTIPYDTIPYTLCRVGVSYSRTILSNIKKRGRAGDCLLWEKQLRKWLRRKQPVFFLSKTPMKMACLLPPPWPVLQSQRCSLACRLCC